MNFITGFLNMGTLSKVLIGIIVAMALSTFILAKYSLSLKASLEVTTGKYETLSEFSIKQGKLLEEERKSASSLAITYKKLDKEYENSKNKVYALPEVDGCLAEPDVNDLLCQSGILTGAACEGTSNSTGPVK
jgi:hypothetical protein